MTGLSFKDAREAPARKVSRKDQAAIDKTEAERNARIRPEPEGISFAAGPIDAHALGVIFERLTEQVKAEPPETIYFVHIHQGEQHRDGCVVTFYPVVAFQKREYPGGLQGAWDATPPLPTIKPSVSETRLPQEEGNA